MRVLWLSWKDSGHPRAGGAEVVLHEIIKRQVADGDEVTLLTAAYKGAPTYDTLDGASVIRVGSNRYTHSFKALWYYRRHLFNKFDMVVEVVNTAPYFVALMPGKAKPVVLYHQLAREVWLHETAWPLNRFGFHVLEPLATRLLSMSKATVLSMSPSTSKDLRAHGFQPKRIHVLTEGIHLSAVPSLKHVAKFEQPTILSLGALRAMKRTHEQIIAFEKLKQRLPKAKLIVAGAANDAYGQKVVQAITDSRYAGDIRYEGKISHARKRELMQRCHVIMVTSIKEGWGLIVSEANSQGTPAVVYDADGLRDSVRHDVTGIVTEPKPMALARAIAGLLKDQKRYQHMRQAAYAFSKTLTFERTYDDFIKACK